jgi:aminomethyltransferase
MADTLRRTALWASHVKLGARMMPFAGYDMPVQYSGLIEEHQAVRTAAGLFDVAHMGVARVEGPGAAAYLDRACTRKLAALAPGRAAYTLLCRENGGTVDDLIVYRERADLFWLVLNAGNKNKDIAYLRSLTGDFDVSVSGPLEEWSVLALQGPKAELVLRALGFDGDWMKPFSFIPMRLTGDVDVKLAFTGYTGEPGCEIFVPTSRAADFWDKTLEAGRPFGLKPVGLGARDTLRTEMGYSLYGHELEEDINPIEAGLSWAVSFDKDFVGKAALAEAKATPRRKLVALKTASKQAPRHGMAVCAANGQVVGKITSGTYAPSLGYAIGLALVTASESGPYFVDIRGKLEPFELAERPFYLKPKS